MLKASLLPSPHPSCLLGPQSLTLDTALAICALTSGFIWRHSLLPFCLASTQDCPLSSGLEVSLPFPHGVWCWARSHIKERPLNRGVMEHFPQTALSFLHTDPITNKLAHGLKHESYLAFSLHSLIVLNLLS